MKKQIQERLSARMESVMLSDTLVLERAFLESDGYGGQKTTWRPVCKFCGRILNRKDSQVVVGERIEAMTAVLCLAPSSLEVYAYDRIRKESVKNKHYEIVGTSEGQTDMLIQSIDVVERNA